MPTLSDWRIRHFIILLGCLLFTALPGCGKGPYPVQGKISFNGGEDIQPLVGGLVVFEPVEPEMKTSSQGEIQPDGTFRLGTFGKQDGAMPGQYKVLVIPRGPPPGDERPRPPVIPRRFQNANESPLEFTVTSERNEAVFTVEKNHPGMP